LKQKFTIFIVFAVLAAALVALNAASYTPKQKTPDNEVTPNRSTYNPGSTGTQAFYSLLSETGRKVVRWQEPADGLVTKKNGPKTFVIIGTLRRPFKESEITGLLRWVSSGGSLVVIDHEPADELVTTTGNWKLKIEPRNLISMAGADPSDPKSMTLETPASKPGQPSVFAAGVNAIQPSRFAGSIKFEQLSPVSPPDSEAPPPPKTEQTPYPDEESYGEAYEPTPTRAPNDPWPKHADDHTDLPATHATESADDLKGPIVDSHVLFAPVVHLVSNGQSILVDVPFGEGRIAFLSDPYIVSNGGIGLVDNSRLAINLVSGMDGVIAFDEYHQGFGADNNRLIEFFAGTPVIAIFFQSLILIGVVLFSQSRRFARALPDVGPDRLSKLEYVTAMAELHRRTRAYDIAVENIYRDFRRRSSRLLGLDALTVSRGELAARISERANADRRDVEDLLFKCDEIIIGEPTNKREVVELTTRIRELEYRLGLIKRSDK